MRARVVRTSTRQVHVVPGASPDLIHHTLALENGEMEAIGGSEELVGDAGHSRPVHQQDRAAFGVELPPALEDGALNGGYVSVSSDEMGVDMNEIPESLRLTLQLQRWHPPHVLHTSESGIDPPRPPQREDAARRWPRCLYVHICSPRPTTLRSFC
jgi:hypothetical protein